MSCSNENNSLSKIDMGSRNVDHYEKTNEKYFTNPNNLTSNTHFLLKILIHM